MKKHSKTSSITNKKYSPTLIAPSVVVVAAVLVAFVAYPSVNSEMRKQQIDHIYSSLNLGNKYTLVSSNIFGEKRPYEQDKGRTRSSSEDFVRCANVDTTVSELKSAISKAGFTYFEEPYPGSTFTELHFKSAKNEYLRLTVSSKPRDDAISNKVSMGIAPNSEDYNMSANSGPSNVRIAINLDDNND